MLHERLLYTLSVLFHQKIGKFPGALPTSVNLKNASLLSKGYVSALKADGERVFAFIAKNKLVFVWRDMRHKTVILPCTFDYCMLLDGELLIKQNLFLIFDVLIYNGEATIRMDHLQRIELANHFICTKTPTEQRFTYANTIVDGSILLPTNYAWGVTWNTGTLRMQVSPRYAVEDCATLWQRRHELPYACDGVIFTRLWCRYKPFTEDMDAILKWKPCVTVDFMVALNDGSHEKCRDVNSEYTCFDEKETHNAALLTGVNTTMAVFTTCALDASLLEVCKSQICEFAWDEQARTWIWQRLRLDKITPNTLTTVLSCLTSIKDRVSIKDIAEHNTTAAVATTTTTMMQ